MQHGKHQNIIDTMSMVLEGLDEGIVEPKEAAERLRAGLTILRAGDHIDAQEFTALLATLVGR